MLPRDVANLSVPPESFSLSGWAPYVRLAPDVATSETTEQAACTAHDGNPVVSLLEWGLSAVTRAGSAIRRAA